MSRELWSSSLHARETLRSEMPSAVPRGLDAGCGEVETARRLRRRSHVVVGLDPDRASIDAARAHGDGVDYVLGDLGAAPFPDASFDVVSAVTMLHHVDLAEGFEQLVRLLRPEGILLVVGLARSSTVRDLARDALDAVAVRRHALTRRVWETPAPKVWPPPLTCAQVRDLSLRALPGSRFRRIPYFRYGLTWRAPAVPAVPGMESPAP